MRTLPVLLILAVLPFLALTGCGYSQLDGELVGQVKKVHHDTPLLCWDYDAADISMGVVRGGIGSMSSEDVHVTIESKDVYEIFQKAAETGALVKVRYDTKRITMCRPQRIVKEVAILE